MRLLAKILGLIVGVILYPLFWLLEWILLFAATIVEILEKLTEDDDANYGD